MKTSGWSSKAKTAAAAYVAYRASKKLKSRKPKLWTGYGYEGDEWEDYQPISNCLSCVSINGNNPNCERADDSFSINLLDQVLCNDLTHYCGFTMGGYGEEGDNVFIQRGCVAKSLYDQARCSIPDNLQLSWNINDGFDMNLVNTHCDYCDSNNCNGWTLRALPDDQFDVDPDSGLPLTLSTILLSLSLYLLK